MSDQRDPGGEAQAGHPRHIDPERGGLGGLGAQQQLAGQQPEFPGPDEVDTRRPGHAGQHGVPGQDPSPTYYDLPVLKEPVWIWSVPAYFYVGGAAAGAALLGAVAQLADRDGHATLIDRCRWVAMGGTVLSTAFLIEDLGRPARFLNMLRIFRPTSAMSVGSWILAINSTAAGASVVLPRLGLRRLGDSAGLGAGAFAPMLGTYTAVLISDTAVPVWQATRRSTPALFAASGLVAATSALELLDHDERDEVLLRRLGTGAKVADLVASEAVEHEADRLERVGRPLHEGASGAMWKTAKACIAGSLAVSLLPVPRGWRRWRRRLSAVLGSVGSLVTRFALFHAGTASARDPRATFEAQRAGHGAAEVTGRPAVTGPGMQDDR